MPAEAKPSKIAVGLSIARRGAAHAIRIAIRLMPVGLVLSAALLAAAVAYGTDPRWITYQHGLDVILWSRRLQWLLAAGSLIACFILISLSISGRKSAWWLVALAPVLALFGHRFAAGPNVGRMHVIEGPTFVAANEAKIGEADWVVGVKFGDQTFAYPYAGLFFSPAIMQADHEKRMMLLWSAYANRALALPINQEPRARDFDVVSTPANALLIYNSRRGQFINGLTGTTTTGEKPRGFTTGNPLPTSKMPWKQWRMLHPDTKVAQLEQPAGIAAPTQPLAPAFPLPAALKLDHPADTRVTLIGGADPLMVENASVTGTPLNAHVDNQPIVVFRRSTDAAIVAMDRRTFDKSGKIDQIVELRRNMRPRPTLTAPFVDIGSGAGWNEQGICIEAKTDAKFLKGRRLQIVGVDEDIPFGTAKYWYSQTSLTIPPAAAEPIANMNNSDLNDPAATKRAHRRHHKKPKAAAASR